MNEKKNLRKTRSANNHKLFSASNSQSRISKEKKQSHQNRKVKKLITSTNKATLRSGLYAIIGSES